jgi:hypothetical protein
VRPCDQRHNQPSILNVAAVTVLTGGSVRRPCNRILRERVGVHRPYLSRETLRLLSPRAAEAAETAALRDAEQYLRDLRVPRNFVDLMFEQASTEIYWLSNEEFVHQLGRRRPAWYEEFLIARCGLDKAAEERYFTEGAAAKPLAEIMAPVHCGQELRLTEAKDAYANAQLDEMMRSAGTVKHGTATPQR